MPVDSFDNNPEKRGLLLNVEIDRFDEVAQAIGSLSKEQGIDVEMIGVPASQSNYRVSALRTFQEGWKKAEIKPQHFTWAVDPRTGENIAVITRDNIDSFDDGSDDLPKSKHSRRTRFFNSVTHRSISNIDMDDGGYIVLATPEHKDLAEPSIRVIRSLELLRKLQLGQISEEKPNGTVGLQGLGEVGIEFFEKYCTTLFPRVDIAQATQELDTERTRGLIRNSKRRLKTWGWVGRQAAGAVFFGKDAAKGAGIGEDQSKVGKLEEVGLISRMPQYPSTRVSKDMNYYGVPFVKLHDDRWSVINSLVAEQV